MIHKSKITVEEILDLGWQVSKQHEVLHFTDITQDSRKVKQGAIFFSYDGENFQAKDFIRDAFDNGASAVFVDIKYRKEILAAPENTERLIFFSNDYPNAAGKMVSRLFGDPSAKMKCIGVTGTNGKTTITWGMHQIFNTLNIKSAYIGTLGVVADNELQPTGLTTPPCVELHRVLFKAHRNGAKYALIEVSSHGMHQGRLSGVRWSCGVFTNLTEEHLDYHSSMEDYYLSKRKFFEEIMHQSLSLQSRYTMPSVIINTDDSYGQKLYDFMAKSIAKKNSTNPEVNLESNPMINNKSFRDSSSELKNKSSQDFSKDPLQEPKKITLCGIGKEAVLSNVKGSWSGYTANLEYSGQVMSIKIPLVGLFNIFNCAVILLSLRFQGFSGEEAEKAVSLVKNVPGRMELTVWQKKSIIIDYAHTPDALKKALKTIHELKPNRIITIFGCGGDRDKEKRPLMGKIASQYSDAIIITNDNPRTEDVNQIIEQILAGVMIESLVELDRRKAIVRGVGMLTEGDVLLIAGKGHEDYQIIGDKKLPFSDQEVIRDIIEEKL